MSLPPLPDAERDRMKSMLQELGTAGIFPPCTLSELREIADTLGMEESEVFVTGVLRTQSRVDVALRGGGVPLPEGGS